MGWGNCGTDSEGRPIGYIFEAVCDHPGCNTKIDRGLSYACGDMHGKADVYCEKYFCSDHRNNWVEWSEADNTLSVCDQCAKDLVDTGDWRENEEEACIEACST